MNKLIHIYTALLIFFFGVSTFTVAQEADTDIWETKTDISNESGAVCPYLQAEPKEGDLFNRGEMLPITTVWFEDFACMDDTEENRRKVIDSAARFYGFEGTDFVNNEPKSSRQNGHGNCYQSTENPEAVVSIYYIYDTETLHGYVHAPPKDGICVAAAGRGGPGGAGMGGG